jgi:hypothetical protein
MAAYPVQITSVIACSHAVLMNLGGRIRCVVVPLVGCTDDAATGARLWL